ncbi:MAG: DUF5335 domain-containing protein [Undibacterium sp.]|uniref:DUF5335 domain-containing protein n=1 Tax=Undibacterium sp. TaxID=1914977 RepID=UPI0027156682|nr:DUF5335 domain-containing protein [Undibacterium sp.]MDO8654450.1 DUF5335 domain-containing protein [Undibacterium sp.]
MATSKLEKTAWQSYFDHISKTIEGKLAEIEVNSLALGSQIQAEWVPLLGITYDKKNDLIEIILDGLDHMIHKPRDIFIEQNGIALSSLEVVDEDDVKQIIKLRDPLLLSSS